MIVSELADFDKLAVDICCSRSGQIEDAAKDTEYNDELKKCIVIAVNKEVKEIINKYGENGEHFEDELCYLNINTIDELLKMIPREKQKIVFLSYGSYQECDYDMIHVVIVEDNGKYELFATDEKDEADNVFNDLTANRNGAKIYQTSYSEFGDENRPRISIFGNDFYKLHEIDKEKYDKFADFIKKQEALKPC